MKVVLILSGGLDSTTLLYKLLNEKKTVKALSFNYGQKGKRELEFAKKTCEKLGVEHKIFDINELMDLFTYSSIVNEDKNNTSIPQNTVVPSRNTILLSFATAYAISNNCEAVYYGAIKGDINDYPDCRPEFLKQMNELNKVNNYKYIPIHAPFIDMEKKEVVKEAITLNVPLDETWSCYVGGEEPCGECFSCKCRMEAIKQAKEELEC